MDRRQHRTPFTSTAYGRINDSEGNQIALCMTPELAKYLALTASNFDQLTAFAKVCRGEYEQMSNPEAYPGYRALIEFLDRLEMQLRGQS